MSSCWNIYAVTKQNNNDISGKPTVTRHNFRNDSARYTELLLLPTLFSSILAVLSNILAFVRKATTCNSEQSPVRQLCGVDTCCSPAFNLFHNPWHYFTYCNNPMKRNHRLLYSTADTLEFILLMKYYVRLRSSVSEKFDIYVLAKM